LCFVDRRGERLKAGVCLSGLERPLGCGHLLDQGVVDLDRLAVQQGGQLELSALGLGPPRPIRGSAKEDS